MNRTSLAGDRKHILGCLLEAWRPKNKCLASVSRGGEEKQGQGSWTPKKQCPEDIGGNPEGAGEPGQLSRRASGNHPASASPAEEGLGLLWAEAGVGEEEGILDPYFLCRRERAMVMLR